MSVTAVYVYASTAFVVDLQSTIEGFASGSSGGYSSISRCVDRGKTFVLEPGVYRLKSDASIVAALPASPALGGGASDPNGYAIVRINTKGDWPDPFARRASDTLQIPMDVLAPFFNDAGVETVLARSSGAPVSPAGG